MAKGFMFWVAFVASLGGFLFGFDTVVISGAEQGIQKAFSLTGFTHGFIMASALFGTIAGALFCSAPAERWGRIRSLVAIAVLYFVSAIGCAFVTDEWQLAAFRFIGGLGVGAASVVGPMYIAEVSPSAWRGRFVAFFQFNIVLGLVTAYVSNWLLAKAGLDWRWMLGVEGVPAILFAALLFTIPESPRWLVKTGNSGAAKGVFARCSGEDAEALVKDVELSLAEEAKGATDESLFRAKYFKPLLIAFLISTLNQLSGINAINYYAPRILGEAGVFADSALFQSILIGVTNLVFTMLGMMLIDMVGRKKLLYVGSFVMTASLLGVAWGLRSPSGGGTLVLVSLMGFIGSFALSLGACIWVIISEVFPTSVRAKGQVFGSMTHWVWCAMLTWLFPWLVENGYSTHTFVFFGAVAAGAFVYAMWLPKTEGKSLEAIQKELVG